jgi:hypothetical protein
MRRLKSQRVVGFLLLAGLSFSVAVGYQNCTSGFGAALQGVASSSSLRYGSGQVYTQASAVSDACQSTITLIGSGVDASAQFQSCLDGAPEGSSVAMPAGVLSISSPIRIRKGIELTTQGVSAPCKENSPLCFEIKAMPNAALDPATDRGLFSILADNATVRSIIFNGNRAERAGSPAAAAVGVLGFSMYVSGRNQTLSGVVIEHTLNGTALWVDDVEGFTFVSNTAYANGDHRGKFADGVTVHRARNSVFSNNTFIDNTDVDFIFGSCQNCKIQNNVIMHSESFEHSAFAAMMFQVFPDRIGNAAYAPGDFTGSDISGNTIDCGANRRCGIGLYLGTESWNEGAITGGFYHDNLIRNAANGFLVEKVGGTIRIKDNIVQSSGGSVYVAAYAKDVPESQKESCVTQAYPYNIPDLTGVQIEDTKIQRSEYARVSYRRYIPNYWNRDILWNAPLDTPCRFFAAGVGGGPTVPVATPVPTPVPNQNATPAQNYLSSLFGVILQRQPAAAELQMYANARCSDLATMVMLSPEAFNLKYANLDNAGFINLVYQGLFGRAADAGGLQNWMNQLQAGGWSRERVIRSLLVQPEFYGRCDALNVPR